MSDRRDFIMKNKEKIKLILITVAVTLGIELLAGVIIFGSGTAQITTGGIASDQEVKYNEEGITTAHTSDESETTTASTTSTTETTSTTSTTKGGNGNNGNNGQKTTAKTTAKATTAQTTTAKPTTTTTKNLDNDGEWVDGWF